MKVLYLGDRPSGGAGESLYQIVAARSRDESILFFAESGFLNDRFKDLKLTHPPQLRYTRSWVRYLPQGKFPISWMRFFLSVLWHTYSIIRLTLIAHRHNIEIIHTNTINCIDGAIAAKILRIPHVFHLRELIDNDYYQYDFSKKKIVRCLSSLGTIVVCNSQRTARGLLELGMPKDQIRTIYNFVETPENANDLRELLSLDPKTKIIGTCGWITPNKRMEDFIALAGRLKDLGDDYRFIILGGWGAQDEYNREIRNLINTAKLNDRLIVTGIIPHAARFFGSMNVFVCCSYTESFGRVVAEALASGTPSIGISRTAVEELIDHEKNGYLVEMGDVDAMEEYVRKILSTPELRYALSSHARDSMKKFHPDVLMPKLEALYHELAYET